MNQKQKYLFVYATIANLPYQHRARSDDIETILVVNRKSLKSLGLADPFSVLLKQMKSDINYLMEHGVEVQIDNEHREKFEVTVSTTCGDNLGICYF